MGPNYGLEQGAESQAWLRRETDIHSPLVGEVDRPSVVGAVDGGTSIPAQVDRGMKYVVEK